MVQTFDRRPLFSNTIQRKIEPCGFPTPAHHSRMGSCQTSAFTRFRDRNDDPKLPAMPVSTTIPAPVEELAWNQRQDRVPSPIPVRRTTWARPSRDSSTNSADRTRNSLHNLPLHDTSRVHGYSHDQIPQINSVTINQEFNFSYRG